MTQIRKIWSEALPENWKTQWCALGGAVLNQALLPHKRLETTPKVHPALPPHSVFPAASRHTTKGGRKKLWPFSARVYSRKSRETQRISGLEEYKGQVVPPSYDKWINLLYGGWGLQFHDRLPDGAQLPKMEGDPKVLTRDNRTRGNPVHSLWANGPRKSPLLSISPWESPPKNWIWWELSSSHALYWISRRGELFGFEKSFQLT